MATFANAIAKISSLLASNLSRAITAVKHREVEMEIVQAISENVTEAQIPVMIGGQFVGYANLTFDKSTYELQMKELRLAGGEQRINYIYNYGTMPTNRAKALPTLRYVISRTPRVIGTISLPVDLTNELRVGETITLDGGKEHEILEGESFLLKGQETPAENVPYTAVSADDVPVVADWYEASKNQEIAIDYGPSSKQVMPAVEEGDPPVIVQPNQSGQLVLTVGNWAANALQLATGDLKISATSLVIISTATKADSDLWADAEVFCVSQGTDILNFTCVTTPVGNITINVIVL
ncbi:MAG: hypothetical protein CVU11_13160 [Bacteroidetes bacterium HGW-Bacteroidetes-6]|jgi:hypothetical protein|nr:MAG: hypothetical protein CVU11_13160 [Bacteroidetes bacterium HGW-Bacteroidetes-6]